MIEIVKEELLMCLGMIGGDLTVYLRCMVFLYQLSEH